MDARSLPEALRQIMRRRGCSQNQLARDLRKPKSWVSGVLNGNRGLEFANVIEVLGRVGWEVRITPKAEEPDPVRRRDFTTKIFQAGAGAAMGGPTLISSSKVGPFENAEYLRGSTHLLRSDLYERGGVALTPMALRFAEQINIRDIIEGRDRKLQMAAAELMRWVGAILCDARRFDWAQDAGQRSLSLAAAAKDVETQAQAYTVLTEINVDRGQADRAITYAGRGLRLAGISDEHQARLNVRYAQSLALVRGQEGEVRDALEQVQPFIEIVYNSESPTVRTGNMLGEIGITLTSLGRHEDADRSLDGAVAFVQESSPFLHGCYLGRQVENALRAAEPSRAADLMLRLAYTAPVVASARIDRHVHRALEMSSPWSAVPEMRDARAQLWSVLPPSARTTR